SSRRCRDRTLRGSAPPRCRRACAAGTSLCAARTSCPRGLRSSALRQVRPCPHAIVQKRAESRKFVHSAFMLARQRKEYLLKVLQTQGQIVAREVSHELQLSEDTIRRDLRELAAAGRLQRVHGGALPSSPAVVDFAGRQQIASDAKVAIGRAAAKLIQ